MQFIKSLPRKIIEFFSWFKNLAFWKNQENLILGLAGIGLNLFLWVYIGLKIKPTGQLIALHYNVVEGIDWHANWYYVFLAPLFGLIIYLINLFIAIYLFPSKKLAGFMFLAATILVQIILIAYFFLLASLIGY